MNIFGMVKCQLLSEVQRFFRMAFFGVEAFTEIIVKDVFLYTPSVHPPPPIIVV